MKNSLEKYSKDRAETIPKVSTSIFLEKKQVEFLRKKNINISKLVREFVNRIMKGKVPKDADDL